jgi:hypothetical protein
VPPKDILEALNNSEIVRKVISVKVDGVADFYVLKIRAELKNGWLMDCWEHKTPKFRRYSFHVFLGRDFIVRWDNTPHYPELKGFPHHKHVDKKVVESPDMTIREVLKEITKIM